MIGENSLLDTNWEEHYIKRGDPTKPTYYIIRREQIAEGLFYRFTLAAGHIKYALSNGWLPVVDMQNYPNPYLAPEKLGKENSWEYYFEQPLRIGLEQAYNGENVILSGGKYNSVMDRPYFGMKFFKNSDNMLTEWQMLVKLGLLKLKLERAQEILEVREKLFAPRERILGVLLRGTDYIVQKPSKHPIPPSMNVATKVVNSRLQAWGCKRMFLATEDKTIVQHFKETFGDLCITLEREYVDFDPAERVCIQTIDRENDHFIQGKDYLTQMVLLSTCSSLVAARCSGTIGVMMLAKRFRHTYFFNRGTYR